MAMVTPESCILIPLAQPEAPVAVERVAHDLFRGAEPAPAAVPLLFNTAPTLHVGFEATEAAALNDFIPPALANGPPDDVGHPGAPGSGTSASTPLSYEGPRGRKRKSPHGVSEEGREGAKNLRKVIKKIAKERKAPAVQPEVVSRRPRPTIYKRAWGKENIPPFGVVVDTESGIKKALQK